MGGTLAHCDIVCEFSNRSITLLKNDYVFFVPVGYLCIAVKTNTEKDDLDP